LALFISTVPLRTASKPSSAGISSPAPNTWIVSRPPDIASMRLARSVALPGPSM
jgi:hypothetical protein